MRQHGYHEVTHEPDPEAEQSEREAEALGHIRKIYGGHRGRGHTLQHRDHNDEHISGYTAGEHQGPALLLHLVDHAHIAVPSELREHLEALASEGESEGGGDVEKQGENA
jgi:hypothetical protein